MKAINLKQLATFSFAALLLASCSDSNNEAGNVDANAGKATTIVGSAVTSITDAQTLAARVSNYKIQNTQTTRAYSGNAFDDVSSMPEEPKVPADAKKMTENWGRQDLEHTGNYVLKSGESYTINFNGGSNLNIYVEDGATLNYEGAWGNGATIYVLSGGKVIVKEGIAIHGVCSVYNYGTIEYKGNSIYLSKPFYNAGDLNLAGKTFNVQGKCYIGGNLIADKIDNNSGMNMYVVKDCTVNSTNELRLSGGKLNVGGKFSTAGNMSLNTSTLFVSGCSVNVNNNLDINSGSTMYVDYLEAKNITLSSGTYLILKDKSMINCTGTFADNNQDISHNYLEGDGAVAVVKASTITFNNGSPTDSPANTTYEVTMFGTPGKGSKIVVDGAFKVTSNWKEITPVFKEANIYLASDTENASSVTIAKTNCNPDGWNDNGGNSGGKDDQGGNSGNQGDHDQTKPDDTPTKDNGTKGDLDLISTIEYPNHTHDISATGIMPFGDKMYMSYHTRGTGHGGCVEVFGPVAENKVQMLQYLYDKALDLDFNHLLAVEHNGKKKVYMPGSSYKKGGILAYMDINANGLLNDESTNITTAEEKKKQDGKDSVTYHQPLQFIQMYPATEQYAKGGYDENCVVYDDQSNRLIVMTTEGYLVYDADSYNEVDRIKKPGKAKHVAIGNNKIATLYFTDRNTDVEVDLPAHVQIFDKGTTDYTAPTLEFDVDMIKPNNGKNVIAINDNKLYVCRGAYGMYVYDLNDNGKELWHYQMPNPINEKGGYKALANGLFVDDNYVYVAYGSYGIVVLDKNGTEHETIAHRQVAKSANYVYVHNGYIYVAYGQDRLQVFKLYGEGIDTSYNPVNPSNK